MFCGKMSDNSTAKAHYRALRAMYDTQTRLYRELLHLSGKRRIYAQKNNSDA